MKINNECARRVLFEVENIPAGEALTVDNLQQKLSEFDPKDVIVVVTLFNRDRYINVLDKAGYDECEVLRDHKIKGLTERGFRALDMIRDDNDWNKMKDSIKNFNELSIYTIFDIAERMLNCKHNELLNLPEKLVYLSSRW